MARPSGTGSGVYQLPNGRWHWRVQVNGRRLRGTAETKAAARRDRAQAFVDAGGTTDVDLLTVTELVDIWVGHVEHTPQTAQVRDRALAVVPEQFMGRIASHVNPPVVAGLWRAMERDGVSPHTIQKAQNALSAAFTLGVEWGMVPSNPIRAAKPKPPPRAAEIQPPTPEEVRRMIEFFDAERRPMYALFVRLMAVIGARPGEMCALRWDGFDAKKSSLRVGQSVSRTGDRVLTDGKNGVHGHRTVYLDLPTARQLAKVERIVGSPWVFTHDGVRPWRPEGVALEFRRAARSLGIDSRLYDLRHFAATQALSAGVPVRDVAAMLGDNASTVLRVYAHASPEQARPTSAVAAALDSP